MATCHEEGHLKKVAIRANGSKTSCRSRSALSKSNGYLIPKKLYTHHCWWERYSIHGLSPKDNKCRRENYNYCCNQMHIKHYILKKFYDNKFKIYKVLTSSIF